MDVTQNNGALAPMSVDPAAWGAGGSGAAMNVAPPPQAQPAATPSTLGQILQGMTKPAAAAAPAQPSFMARLSGLLGGQPAAATPPIAAPPVPGAPAAAAPPGIAPPTSGPLAGQAPPGAAGFAPALAALFGGGMGGFQ